MKMPIYFPISQCSRMYSRYQNMFVGLACLCQGPMVKTSLFDSACHAACSWYQWYTVPWQRVRDAPRKRARKSRQGNVPGGNRARDWWQKNVRTWIDSKKVRFLICCRVKDTRNNSKVKCGPSCIWAVCLIHSFCLFSPKIKCTLKRWRYKFYINWAQEGPLYLNFILRIYRVFF